MSGIALALENYPDADQNDWFEIIEGVKTMAASAGGDHNAIAARMYSRFDDYFSDHYIKAVTFIDVDVFLPDGNIFRPDLCVVSDLSKVGEDMKVHGVPDLCVEVLSPSTAKNDRGIKKNIYARNGVREYWIVDRRAKDVYVYKLDGDHYELDEVYHSYSKGELSSLTDAERAEVKDKIPVGIYPNLLIDLKYIFRSLFD